MDETQKTRQSVRNYETLLGMNKIEREVIGGEEVFRFLMVEPQVPREDIHVPPPAFWVEDEYPNYDEPSAAHEHTARWVHRGDVDDLARARIPQPPDENFLWATHKGEHVLKLADMATPHLFYALRMLFNHSVPPCFRVPGDDFLRYVDVPNWNPAYRAQAIRAMRIELIQREDLICERHGESLAFQFADIISNTEVILALGL